MVVPAFLFSLVRLPMFVRSIRCLYWALAILLVTGAGKAQAQFGVPYALGVSQQHLRQ